MARGCRNFCKQQNVTPNIDRLAEQGGLFANSFCGNSLCSPSRAAILTGLHAHANGLTTIVSQKPIPSTVWNYQKGLREAGYQTALIGKWHLISAVPENKERSDMLPKVSSE
jgi:hypothetical protein